MTAIVIIGMFVLTTLACGAYRIAAVRRRSSIRSARYHDELSRRIIAAAQKITAGNAEQWLQANDGTAIRLHAPVNGRFAMERLPNGTVDYAKLLDVEYIVFDSLAYWVKRVQTTVSDTQSVALVGMMQMFGNGAPITGSSRLCDCDLATLFVELTMIANGVSE